MTDQGVSDLVERVRHRTTNRLRIAVRGARAQVRSRGGTERPLPDFVLLGAQRCGTTALYQDLVAHPQVQPALGKELQYFSLHHRRSLDWYRAHFPLLGPGEQTFEASPYYLFHPSVPARVATALPEARFVVLLRNPVGRAVSHYVHTCRTGHEPLGLEDAIEAEPERMRRAHELGLDSDRAHDLLRQYSYVSRGRYAEQLARWFGAVPRERIHLIRTEELGADPQGQFAALVDFLGLEPFAPPHFSRHTRRRQGAGPQLSDRTRALLQQRLEADSRELLRLTGWPHAW